MIKAFIQRILTALINCLLKWTARFGVSAPAEPRFVTPDYQRVNLGGAPEFSGSPEETVVLMQMMPKAKVHQRAISAVSKEGTMRVSVEEMRLTPFGKMIARTDFVAMDDHLQLGPVEALKGCCLTCQRFSFRGGACQNCGGFTCAGCGKSLNNDTRILCPRCLQLAEASQDNWEMYDLKRRCE